jgi:hypothetical protein
MNNLDIKLMINAGLLDLKGNRGYHLKLTIMKVMIRNRKKDKNNKNIIKISHRRMKMKKIVNWSSYLIH